MSDRPEMVRFVARDRMAERVREATPRAEVVLVDGEVPVIRIYDVLDSWGGFWGVSATEVAAALDAIPADTATLEVHLNSPGGQASEGVAIANLLRQHPARVVAVVDGLAASAASMVAMGANEVVMAPSSQMLVHEASGGAWGTADVLAQQSRALDHLSDSYAAGYAGKAGGDVAFWREVMRAETWYSPAEAIAAGLADRLLADSAVSADPAAAVARHDLRMFAHAGRQHAPAPPVPSTASAAEPAAAGGTNRKEPDTMSDTLIPGLRERLGFADDADEATVLACLDEALSERAEQTTAPAAVPTGHVTIPEARLRDLEAGAAAGTQAAAQLQQRERTEFLDSMCARYAPTNRAAWETEYDRDPEGTRAHFAAAPDLLPVASVGHAGEPETPATTAAAVRESDVYKNWSTT